MNDVLRRSLLAVTSVLALLVGVWAQFWPGPWYESFPGLGMRWLPVLGPYNEHLARDVGSMYLAMVALTACAAISRGSDVLIRVAGLCWLVQGVPHLLFHLAHLGMYEPLDQVLNVVSLGWFVVVGAICVLPTKGAGRLSGSPASSSPPN